MADIANNMRQVVSKAECIKDRSRLISASRKGGYRMAVRELDATALSKPISARLRGPGANGGKDHAERATL